MSFDFLTLEILGNQITDYLIALTTLIVGILTISLLQSIIIQRFKRWARKTASRVDDALLRVIEAGLLPLLYLGTFYVAIGNLTLHPVLEQAFKALMLILATIVAVRLIVSGSEYLLCLYWQSRADGQNLKQMTTALVPAIRTIAWTLGIIFVLDNLGFSIAAVLAGLGIGGVAIALASQGVLEDLFSYFAILLDRPFELGDAIAIGEFAGTVEHVGIKTTRIKSFSGEEIIMANKDLTSSRIRNYRRLQQRQIIFKLAVAYETPQEKLQRIPEVIRSIIESVDQAVFDRAHFISYGEFSLNFEVAYHIDDSSYTLYMDIQQTINLRLKQEFAQLGINFAYPTQITYERRLNGHLSESLDRSRPELPEISSHAAHP